MKDTYIKKRMIDSDTGDVIWEDGEISKNYTPILFAVSSCHMPNKKLQIPHIKTEDTIDVNDMTWLKGTEWEHNDGIYWFRVLIRSDNNYDDLAAVTKGMIRPVYKKVTGAFTMDGRGLYYNDSLLPPGQEPVYDSIDLFYEITMLNMVMDHNPATNNKPLTLAKVIKFLDE